MLVWSRAGRWSAWGAAALLLGLFYLLPLGVIALGSLAGQWNGMLPSHLTLRRYADALQGDSSAELRVSLLTGLMASLLVSNDAPTCPTAFSSWLQSNAGLMGRTYTSELAKRFADPHALR